MANRVMSNLLQTGFKWENKTRTTYKLLAFMHVLSVPGKASIDATKASVVALKFLKYNNKKKPFKVLPLPLSRRKLSE